MSPRPPDVAPDDERGGRTGAIARLISGRWTKYMVVVLWILLVGLTGGLASKLEGAQSNDLTDSLPANAESTQVLRVQSSFTSPDLLPAVVVYERPSGLTNADPAKIGADVDTFGQRKDLVGKVDGPALAKDGKAAQVIVPLNLGSASLTSSQVKDAVTELLKVARQGANGLSAHVAGPAGSRADQSNALSGINSTLLAATIVVVVTILLLTYRSPVLWLLPLVSTGIALTFAQAILYLLVDHAGLSVSEDASAILTILVFGASTDYALLLITRYREELRRHADRHRAMAVAIRRAGPAIIASAATVAVGLLCLMFAQTKDTRGLGPVAAIGIFASFVVMLTLLPALLVIFGRWIFWPVRPGYGTDEPSRTGVWARLGAGIARRPRVTWVVTAAALGIVALGVGSLDATGLTNKENFRGHQDSIAGEEVLLRHFAAGAGSPVAVISRPDTADAVRNALSSTRSVDPSSVTDPVVKGAYAYVEGTLVDPADSSAAHHTVDRVRERVHAVAGADAKVGGESAIALDVQRAAKRDRNVIIPIVLAVVFLVLVLLLRALVAPLVLMATVVLSFAAALGASAWIFKNGFRFGGEDPSFPLFVFVFLVALGVDYNIFLMTRVREETARSGTKSATVTALAATGGVITSAGLALAGTFGSLATLPLTILTELGFAVAFGVLLDTVVVRSVLVPALTLHIERFMWWPGKLFRASDSKSIGPIRAS
jgi:RND superfamily putative drug exporter